MDQPTADGVNSYYVSLAASEHVTVALSGTGADELFLGYDRDAALLTRFDHGRMLNVLPRNHVARLARWLRHVPEDALWPRVRGRVASVRAHASLDTELMSTQGIGVFDAPDRDAILAPQLRRELGQIPAPAAYLRDRVAPDPGRPGDWLARAEQGAYLSWVLLRDIDAMSMAHSLEVRVPFLDRALVEAAARIPWQWKSRNGVGKWILREAVRDLLPTETLTRPKMGFGLPYLVWMRRSLAPLVRDTLAGSRLHRRGVLHADRTAALVDRFFAGDDLIWRQVWTLFVLEAWANDTLDALPAGACAFPPVNDVPGP
jgi:asparagine synthase (glutamine-hydrolysing)